MSATRRRALALRRVARRFKAWLREMDLRGYGMGRASW
jgi:hypothetical protein